MLKSPVYTVIIGGEDLTRLVTSFAYEDSAGEDNLLKISFASVPPNFCDLESLQPGKKIKFRFGYLNGETSGFRTARISNVKVNFAKSVSANVEGIDLGILLKKEESNKIWKNKTVSQIAEEIATRHGLKSKIESTTERYESLPQGNKTDFDFLRYLVAKEGDGRYHFYILDDTLFFKKRDLDQKSSRSFTWGGEEGNVISFSPQSKETSSEAASKEVTAVSFDPSKASFVETKVNAKTETPEAKLGKNEVYFNAAGEQIRQTVKVDKQTEAAETGKRVFVHDTKEAKPKANSLKKTAALKDIEARIVVVGDPTLKPDTIVDIECGSKKYSGTYYVKKVSHKVAKGSVYTSTLELGKNATNEAAATVSEEPTTTKTNNSIGPKGAQKQSKTPETVSFDSRGRQI